MEVFTIKDLKGNFYDTLFTAPSVSDGICLFDQLVFSSNSKIGNYCEDYGLVHLGSFCSSSADFNLVEPRVIVTAEERKIYWEVQRKLRDQKVDRELPIQRMAKVLKTPSLEFPAPGNFSLEGVLF